MKKIVTLSFIACFSLLRSIEACTAFQLQSEDGAHIYYRSMEFGFPLKSDLLIVPRGTEYIGAAPGNKPGLRWKVTYGYVGMNQQIMPTLVSDGMNEKGLVVGCLYLPGFAQFETPDPKKTEKTLGSSELCSFLLGTCATVSEVKEMLPKILVAEEPVNGMQNFVLPLHYYICDQTSEVLIVEYVNGQRHMYDNQSGVLTNSPPLDWHLSNLPNYTNLSPVNAPAIDFGNWKVENPSQGTGLLGIPGDYTAPSRFVRAAFFSKWAALQKTALEAVCLGFHILNAFDIFEGIIRERDKAKKLLEIPPNEPILDITQWVIVHDRTNLKTYFRNYDSLSIQMVDLKKINFGESGFKKAEMKKDFIPEDITSSFKSIGLH